MHRIPRDVVISLESPNCWVVNNVFTRTCLGIDNNGITFMGNIGSIPDHEIIQLWIGKDIKIWEIEYFSNYSGLLEDPTRRIREIESWPKPIIINGEQLFEKLKKHWLIIEDEKIYKEIFNLKNSLLDNNHLGNFHQQLGQELLLFRREDPSEWWIRQKFSEDCKSLRNNLYSAIQGAFLKKFFSQKITSGMRVIDIGCGVGFYANMIASCGASVLGIDPNRNYIEIARRNAVPGAEFEVLDIGKVSALDAIPSYSVDIVFMSDALLFYFVSPTPQSAGDIQVLFQDIRRILKREGRFYSMEPHYIFWLVPWLGEIDHPFTILTEYLQRKFQVTPSFSELFKVFREGGLAVLNMEELRPDPAFEKINPRAFHFANQFPLWHIFELKVL